MKKSKILPKIDAETLNSIFELAKANNDTATMLQCTQVVLLSEMKKDLTAKLDEISAAYKTITEALSDCNLGIEIYPKSNEEES